MSAVRARHRPPLILLFKTRTWQLSKSRISSPLVRRLRAPLASAAVTGDVSGCRNWCGCQGYISKGLFGGYRLRCCSRCASAAHRGTGSGKAEHLTLGMPAHRHAGDAGKTLTIELQWLMAIEDRCISGPRDSRLSQPKTRKNSNDL